jgi:hypothetical protein
MSPHEAGICGVEELVKVVAMARHLRKAWAARLVAATLSLALAMAPIAGAAAHVIGHGDAHAHHHGAIIAADSSPDPDQRSAHSEDHHRVSGAGPANMPEPAHQHSGCVDFVCHGGLAVLAAATAWNFTDWPKVAVFPWNTQALASVIPARLDRPPKSLGPA